MAKTIGHTGEICEIAGKYVSRDCNHLKEPIVMPTGKGFPPCRPGEHDVDWELVAPQSSVNSGRMSFLEIRRKQQLRQ